MRDQSLNHDPLEFRLQAAHVLPASTAQLFGQALARMDGYLEPCPQTLEKHQSPPSKHPDAYPGPTPPARRSRAKHATSRNFLGNQKLTPERNLSPFVSSFILHPSAFILSPDILTLFP